MQLSIVGIQHRTAGFDILNALRRNHPLILIREPQNSVDPNAILCVVPIGYVRASSARGLSPKIDALNISHLNATLIDISEFGARVELSDPLQKDLFHDL